MRFSETEVNPRQTRPDYQKVCWTISLLAQPYRALSRSALLVRASVPVACRPAELRLPHSQPASRPARIHTHLSFIRTRTAQTTIASSPPRDTGHLQSSFACALDSILQPTLHDRKSLLRHFYGPVPTKARPLGSTGLRLKADHRSGREIQVGNPPRSSRCFI